MKCQIISIGDELLMGDTVNTNAGWMGQLLAQYGVKVTRVHTIGDDLSMIKETIRRSLGEARLVITTGGLGPTNDDLTKRAVQEIFGCDLVVHQPTLSFIREKLSKRNIPFSHSNYQQAEVPEACEVLFNGQGTAPGMWFEKDGSCLVVLPGVPFEMQHLMEQKVVPRIRKVKKGSVPIISRYILTAGIGESTLSDMLGGQLEDMLNERLQVAFLPGLQGVRIRITAQGKNKSEINAQIEEVAELVYGKAGDVIVGEGKEFSLGEAVGNLLRRETMTLAVAESCTGGMLADQVTNIPGSSEYMLGGVVVYANSVKKDLLKVTEEDLISFGAVSKPVALQMARGVAERMGADIGVSTTGIAGPGGGTREKPVGTVWIGCWTRDRHFALKTLFTNDRLINKERSVAVALDTVRRTILGLETMPYGLKPQTA